MDGWCVCDRLRSRRPLLDCCGPPCDRVWGNERRPNCGDRDRSCFAWLSGGSGGSGVQTTLNLPGEVVVTAGIRTTLGASTNEDEIIIAEKSNLILVGGETSIRVFPQVGSSTLTVRVQAYANAALVVKNPAAILRISGFANPTF